MFVDPLTLEYYFSIRSIQVDNRAKNPEAGWLTDPPLKPWHNSALATNLAPTHFGAFPNQIKRALESLYMKKNLNITHRRYNLYCAPQHKRRVLSLLQLRVIMAQIQSRSKLKTTSLALPASPLKYPSGRATVQDEQRFKSAVLFLPLQSILNNFK